MTKKIDAVNPLLQQLAAWQGGIEQEILFWRTWVETQGAGWSDAYRMCLDYDRPIAEPQRQLLTGDISNAIVVDVGAGPLTSLGKHINGARPKIIACDPLMRYYLDILRSFDVSPLTETREAFAEDLSSYFDSDSVDLVCCSNALDHSYDPVRGLEEMLCITKPGGAVFLSHAMNEAEHEKYSGFHQWNFADEDGRFIIWNRSSKIDVAEHFMGICTVALRCFPENRLIEVSLIKLPDVTGRLNQLCQRRKSERIVYLNGAMLSLANAAAKPSSFTPSSLLKKAFRRIGIW